LKVFLALMDGLAGAGSPENKELAVATMSEKVAISDFDLSSKWVYVTEGGSAPCTVYGRRGI
jgi:hypothetical protein